MHDLNELASQKDFLRTIVEDDFCLPHGIEPFALVKALLSNLGSSDEELRDTLNYPILEGLIVDEQEQYRLTDAQLEELLLTSIDQEHLFYRIGETGTDSVFLRSSSTLLIPLLLIADARRQVFSELTVRCVLEALFTYARQERDWRGYIKGKGWAHSVAHLSDALDDCAKNRFMTASDCAAILETLTYLAQLPEPLAYEEDDRLAFVAYGIIKRQSVEQTQLKGWIASLVIERPENVLIEEGVLAWNRAANAKNFLHSLYFLLNWSKAAFRLEQKIDLLVTIDEALQKLNSLPPEWFADEEQETGHKSEQQAHTIMYTQD